MSWKATAWAIQQTTGSFSRKVLLLALANYADEHGLCWPSQETLARNTEQSVDTVQRQLKNLMGLRLLDRERMPKRRGQWQGYKYRLLLQAEPPTQRKHGGLSREMRSGQAATSLLTMPHSLRPKPSIEPLYEPSHSNVRDGEGRQQAYQKRQEGSEVVQNRIARRIGDDGWLVLGEMNDAQRSRLSTLERQGRLSDEILSSAVLQVGITRPR